MRRRVSAVAKLVELLIKKISMCTVEHHIVGEWVMEN